MSKQYLKKLKGTDTPIATRYKPAFSDSEYTGFGELYRNGKWYKDVAVFADDFDVQTTTNNYTISGAGSLSIDNNRLKYVDSTTDGTGTVTIDHSSLTVGKRYKVLWDFRTNDGDRQYAWIRQSGVQIIYNYPDTTAGIYSGEFLSDGTQLYFDDATNGATTTYYKSIAIVPLNDDGSIDISGATELTVPQTYLPIEVEVDEQGNLLNVDRMDLPTLVEDYVVAKKANFTKANFTNGWKSEGMDAYACRAWVNFDGSGTVAIRASGNVSSITDNGGNGDYTVNFTTAMPDANYCCNVTGYYFSSGSSSAGGDILNAAPTTTSSARIKNIFASSGSARDLAQVNFGIFR